MGAWPACVWGGVFTINSSLWLRGGSWSLPRQVVEVWPLIIPGKHATEIAESLVAQGAGLGRREQGGNRFHGKETQRGTFRQTPLTAMAPLPAQESSERGEVQKSSGTEQS